MIRRRWNRSGFLMIEMMVALGLLAVAAELCVQLIRTSLRTTQTAVISQEIMSRQASAMRQLSADVLQSDHLASTGGDSISIDDHIRWRSDSGGLHRAADTDRHDFAGVQLNFAIDDGSVLVRPVQATAGTPARLISVRHWLKDAQP